MNGSVSVPQTDPAQLPAAQVRMSPDPRQVSVYRSKLGRRLEWSAVSLAACFTISLHIRFVTEVGGLWRDETNSVNLANLPTLAEFWHFLDYDSFPALYFFVLRVWSGIFGSANDESLRALGLIIGVGVIAVLWNNARVFGAKLPVLSLPLVGLNPMIVRYGDSNRAYGLGIILILLTLGSFWELVKKQSMPSTWRIVRAAVLAVLSVQCLYYNSMLLLAIAAGAVAVAARARAWRNVWIILGTSALAAASLLPYAPIIIRMQGWTFLVSYRSTFSWLWKRAGEVTGSPHPWGVWLWAGLVVAALGAAVINGTRALLNKHTARCDAHSRGGAERIPAPVLFAAIALAVGISGYALFLRVLNYYTQPWYYITLAVFVACTLETVFAWPTKESRNPSTFGFRIARPVIAVWLLCSTMPAAWYEIGTRHTNADLVGTQMQKLTQEGDVVLIPRWECAISLCRYFHGKAEVITLPPIGDHRFHRYDLVLKEMDTPDAIQPVLEQIEQTLRSGHKVFLADILPFPGADVQLPNLIPAYKEPRGGWDAGTYYEIWKAQAGQFLRAHATRLGRIEVPLPPGVAVQDFEELRPAVVQGWK